jgi:hypothetical protein
VNKVKCFVRQIHAPISRAKPRDYRHARPTARHAHRCSVALEFTNVSRFVSIVRSFGSLAPPNLFHPFGYPQMTHSRHAPRLAVDCDSVMLVVSWMSNLELIAANS